MDEQNKTDSILTSRIFSTEVGMRPAEPCSLTIVATQQLLTNLFIHVSAVLLSDERFRRMTMATITDQDLCILETCNRTCVDALSGTWGIYLGKQQFHVASFRCSCG